MSINLETDGTKLLGTIVARNNTDAGGRLCLLLGETDARAIRDMLEVDLRDGKFSEGKTRQVSFPAALTHIPSTCE